ncbi:uncharacterized protein V1516DRAFT_615798, partial [Lipomyces oligophaga]|uniref:uncharacterized protein n=1 Tax=Lipomyces oligophaga TaxID=45792 RepID=UPI0034CE1B00
MNSTDYLVSYGWTPGTGFKKGSIARPILVHHKKDTKGLGNSSLDTETWWERVFDGQLQTLDVFSEKIPKEHEQSLATIRAAKNSKLYSMFVRGQGLEGSIGSQSSSLESTPAIESTSVNREVNIESLEANETIATRSEIIISRKGTKTSKQDTKKDKKISKQSKHDRKKIKIEKDIKAKSKSRSKLK